MIPGRSVRATARLATALAVSFEATCAALAARRPAAVLRDRHADPRLRRHRPRSRPGRGSESRPESACSSIFGGSQAVRRFNAAVAEALPRLVERVDVIHVTGDDGYAAALAGARGLPGRSARALPAVPVPRATRCSRRSSPPTWSSAGPGSSTLAEVTALGLPMVVVPVPARGRPPAGERAPRWSRPAPRGSSRTRRSTPRRCSTPRRSSTTRPRTRRWPRRPAALGRPGAADAVAELVLAAADARAAARRRRDRPASRGMPR